MARKHNEDEVRRTLGKKHDVRIAGMEIFILNQNLKECKHDLGNGSLGKIDFLVNHRYYSKYRVNDYKSFQKIREY